MIADKADAVVVPVRIRARSVRALSYLKNGEIKRSWFPKVTITILPPRGIRRSTLVEGQGQPQRRRRRASGLTIDGMVTTAMLDHTLFEALVRPGATAIPAS